MKVIYDDEQEVYIVKLEDFENTTIINTDDIVEARERFIKGMTTLFNDAICDALKDSF